jgi:hypothetical protein
MFSKARSLMLLFPILCNETETEKSKMAAVDVGSSYISASARYGDAKSVSFSNFWYSKHSNGPRVCVTIAREISETAANDFYGHHLGLSASVNSAQQ